MVNEACSRPGMAGVVLAFLTLGGSIPGWADVVTDGTLGRRTRLPGPHVEIGADLGRVRGKNLFHSFERFNVETGGSATFTGPAGLENVIGRVTGGERSSIDGTLRSTVDGANLWLLNPAGILFGPNARLDVKGSFHASTADELRFSDGAVFSALDTEGSVLSVAAPESFGFLGRNVGTISVQGSLIEFPPGETLSLTAGDIDISGGNLRSTINPPNPSLGGAGIVLAAQHGAGAVSVAPDAAAVARDGRIRIAFGEGGVPGNVGVLAPGGGRIRIEGGAILIDGVTVGTINVGDIDDTGGVDLAARSLTIQNTVAGLSSGIATITDTVGRAGPIRVTAPDIAMAGGVIVSTPLGPGGGGPISIAAERMTVSGSAIGVPILDIPGTGASGEIAIEAREFLTLDNGAGILSTSLGETAAGAISITTGGTLSLTGRSVISAETLGTGTGGSVLINARDMHVDNSFIGANTAGPMNAGTVTVLASNDITFVNEGRIFNGTTAGGSGGTVQVGALGDILIDGTVDHDPLFFTGITASAEAGSTGAAPAIAVAARRVEIVNGGRIGASTRGTGPAGQVGVVAVEEVSVRGSGVFGPSSISVSSENATSGPTGFILIQGLPDPDGPIIPGVVTTNPDVVLADGGRVQAINNGSQTSGGIFILGVRSLRLTDGASITAESATADAGNITIDALRSIELQDSRITTSAAGGQGGGGNITFTNPDVFTLNDSTILAQALEGQGGNIDITADLIVRSPESLIDASSAFGVDGTVSTSTPEVDLAGSLLIAPSAFVDIGRLLRESCAARGLRARSTFTRTGKGGLPPSPDRPLAAGPGTGSSARQQASASEPVALDVCDAFGASSS